MINALMEVTPRQLNVFPAKDRTSCEFTPSAIMGEQKLNHKKQLQFTRSECAEAHLNQTTWNNTVKRTLDLMCSCPDQNPGGGH